MQDGRYLVRLHGWVCLGATLTSTTASENAACFAFFLSQHKAELGILTIDKVTVFRNDGLGNVNPDLVFHIAEVPNIQVAGRELLDKVVTSNESGSLALTQRSMWRGISFSEVSDLSIG